jgi:hypothetical protein
VNMRQQNTLEILQLLLRCGMVCREELNVVFEMMDAVPGSREIAIEERDSPAPRRREVADSETRKKTLVLDFDSRL